MLVSRDRELGEIDALRRSAGAWSGLILVTGEPGIGKTALCSELAGRAKGDGDAVAWAACWRSPPTPPLWPWRRVVRDLLGMVGSTPADVGPLGGWLEHLAGGEAPVTDPESALAWVVDALAAAFDHVGRRVVVVFDDLQWADERSLDVLVALAAQLPHLSATVLASCRGDELDPERLALLSARARVVPLARLDRAGVGAIADEATDDPVDVDELYRHTGGNPLFVHEMLRVGACAGSVPVTVSAVLADRWTLLSESARQLVDVGAIIGEEFTLNLLQRVLGGERGTLTDELDEALRLGLVAPAGAAGRYRFSHTLAREAVLDLQSTGRRWELHEHVAQVLEAARRDGADVDAAVLAYHFAEAGSEHVLRAVAYAREAARIAMDQFAAVDAVRVLQEALAVVEYEWFPAERLALLNDLGGAQHAAGDVAVARATFQSAIRLARARGERRTWAHLALGFAGGDGFEVPMLQSDQLVVLEDAIDGLDAEERGLRARLLARLAVAGAFEISETRRLELAEEAVVLARPIGGAVLIDALAAHCDAIAGPAHVTRRLTEASEIIELALAERDRHRELLGRRLRVVALLELGDIAAFDGEVDAFARTAALLRRPLYDWYVPLWRGARALMAGDFDTVEALLGQVEGIGAVAGSDNARLLAAVQRWWLLTDRGQPGEALDVVAAAVSSSPVPPVGAQVSMALALAQAGRVDEARAILDRLLPDQLAGEAHDSEWLPMLCEAAAAVHAVGGHPQVRWLYDALLSLRDLFVVEGIGACCLGSVELFLAMVAPDPAPHLERAVAADRRIGGHAAATRASNLVRHTMGTFRCDGDTWIVGWNSTERSIPDRKGLHDIAYLLARPHQRVHVFDLVGGGEVAESTDRQLDAIAVAAYRRRLHEIEAALDDADAHGDADRSRALTAERAALIDQLRTGRGLGGRSRPLGTTAAERARSAVTQRVRDALRRVEGVDPELASHLHNALSTGTYCSYAPPEPVIWSM